MDEYVGLPGEHPQSFRSFLNTAIFGRLPFKSVDYLDGSADDVHEEISRYSQNMRENPPDIVFMGIGENGHIAFNDPHVAGFDDLCIEI